MYIMNQRNMMHLAILHINMVVCNEKNQLPCLSTYLMVILSSSTHIPKPTTWASWQMPSLPLSSGLGEDGDKHGMRFSSIDSVHLQDTCLPHGSNWPNLALEDYINLMLKHLAKACSFACIAPLHVSKSIGGREIMYGLKVRKLRAPLKMMYKY